MLKFVSFDIVFQEIPDEVTLAVNLSGCPNLCEGCHSPHLRENIGNELTLTALDSLIEGYFSSITCVCFMGGDNDPVEIERLGTHIHERWGLKTAWYSGRTKMPADKNSLNYIKLGGYTPKLGALKSRTTNQCMYRLDGETYTDITSKFWK